MSEYNTSLVLENIRSAENVGGIFRTADAIGIDKIYLIGITPAPIDRFGRVQPKVQKAALGAEETMDWQYVPTTRELIERLKEAGVHIVALEQDEKATDYKKFELQKDTAFIVGTEVSGIEKDTLSMCNEIIEIPMKGEKESLNVAVSVGVALYRILDN